MDNDDWAEAFALAEGRVNDASSLPNRKTSKKRNELPYKKSPIGSTSQVGGTRNDIDLGRVAPFLPPITVDQESFYGLQGPLLENVSKKYRCRIYTVSIKGLDEDHRCAVCGSPPGLHLMNAKENPTHLSTSPSASFRENLAASTTRLYVGVRNLRCSLRAQPESKPSDSIVRMLTDQIDQLFLIGTATPKSAPTNPVKQERNKKRRRCDDHGSSLILQLDEKLLEACQQVTELLPRFPAQGVSDQKLVWAIRTIMACDSVYYRLYYADLTSEGPLVIPHPVQYFGGWDIAEVEDPLTNTDARRSGLKTIGLVGKAEISHALERLHSLRMDEGRSLFSRLSAMQDWSLLREWQDSCRDFLCHLYAYATLSSDSLRTLKERLRGHNTVVEVGAGTGYLSRLIGNVIPYDCHPAGSTDNEYHAATPPFTTVKVGGPRDIGACSSLILCYPPVDNDMAFDALEVFLNRSKNKKRTQQPLQERNKPLLLVHIGEFQGLTGTPRFESLLVEKMICVARLPCLSWGSDAAEISFWQERQPSALGGRDNSRQKQEHLVSCWQCKNRPATIRFRHARTYCYCAIECAKLDETVLRGVVPSCFANLLTWTVSESSCWEFLRDSETRP